MKGFSLTRNFWVALVTMIVIGLLFMYYLMVYVKGRERLIYEKEFRELARVGKNINTFKHELVKRIRTRQAEAGIEKKLSATIQTKEETEALINEKIGADDFNVAALLSKLDSLKDRQTELTGKVEVTTYVPYADHTELVFEHSKGNWVKINFSDSLKKSSLFNNTSLDKFLLVRVLDSVDKPDTLNAKREGEDERCSKCPKTQKPLPGQSAKIIFQNLKNEVRLQNIDSLILQKNGLNWSGVTTHSLGNTEYKLFTSWLPLDQGDDLLLCAFVESDTIKSEASAVEPWVIINMASIFLFLFLVMPLLKLLIMNEVERLQIVNVLASGVAIILGTALTILFVIFTNHYFGYHYREMDRKLDVVSNSVKTHFLEEIHSLRKQLHFLRDKQTFLFEKIDPKTTPIWQSAVKDVSLNNFYTKEYNLYNQIFWANKLGKITLVLESNKINTNLPVVNEREYFKAVLEDNLWPGLPGQNPEGMGPFYVDFIRSMLDGHYQVVLSNELKSKDTVAIAISTKMYSLQFSSLPPGYNACIIDQKGNVKFHSSNDRSLQENFLEETDFEPELESALDGRIAQHTTITYDKKKYRAYIQPLDGMPLFLVTFYSLEYYKVPMVLTVWFTTGLVIALFLLIIIHLGLLFAVTYRPSKLKIRRFFLSWLRPKKPLKYRDKYIQSIVGCSLLLLLFAILFYYFPVNRETTVGVLLVPVFLLAFHYRLYADHENTERKNTTVKNVQLFTRLSILFVLFVDVVACYLFDDLTPGTAWLFLLQGLMALVLYVPFAQWFPAVRVFLFPNTGYKKLYLYSSLLWLALVSIFPVFYFYKYSYNEESKVWAKHLQLEAARDYVERRDYIKTNLATFSASEGKIQWLGDYQNATGAYRRDSIVKNPQQSSKVKEDSEVNRYQRFLFQLIPPLDELINRTRAQAYDQTEGASWHWTQQQDTLTLFYRSASTQAEDLSISTVLHPFQFNKGEHALLFWLAIIAGNMLAFRTIRFVLRNIYGFDIIKPIHEVVVSADFFRLNENKEKDFFVIGLPYSGKGKMLKRYLAGNRNRILRINLQTQIERIPNFDEARIVVIEHFEFGINNHELNKIRLRLLQDLQARNNVQLILCSAVQPHVILDYYDRMESLTMNLKERDEFKKEYIEYKHARRFWRSVLGGFVVIYLPLNQGGKSYPEESELIDSELSHGTFLPKLKSHVSNQPIDSFSEREDFILKVEDMATPYYHSLWNSFSKAEKRLLYDLAIDRFMNVKNINVIRALLQKGVLVIGDSLQIFNKSFNNFILSVIKEDEEIQMQQEMRNKGSWNSVQLVLILIFLAMGMFVAFAQRDILQNFNALMTALGGVTALLLRFGGLFTTGNKPKE